jgi:REP element-mobilizing transposase RayT
MLKDERMDKFKNKYRIDSARAAFWDYARNGAYFVTICTQNRVRWFGRVKNKKMELSTIGNIANACWLEIPNHFPFVELGAHIIMPDHVHGIVVIKKNGVEETQNIASLLPRQNMASPPPEHDMASPPPRQNMASPPPEHDMASPPPEHDISSPPPPQNMASPPPEHYFMDPPKTKNKFGPQSKNLASIIRGFKVGVTKNARFIHPQFQWQSRFHERIIFDDKAFNNVSKYIINNPSNW